MKGASIVFTIISVALLYNAGGFAGVLCGIAGAVCMLTVCMIEEDF